MALSEFLSGMPQAPQSPQPSSYYTAFMPNLRQPVKKYYQPRFGDIYDEYEAMMARPQNFLDIFNPYRASRQKDSSVTPFESFLSVYPFEQKYAGVSPWEKGMNPSRYAPPARFLYY